MKYMGSKARHAEDLLSIMLKDREPNQYFVDLFTGGANVIDKVEGNRIGIDNHFYLVSMLKSASIGWMPPEHFTEDEYKKVTKNPENYPPELVGYVGFALSYSGKWNGGWCRDGQGKRRYDIEAYKNAVKQFPKLRGVEFFYSDYRSVHIPIYSIVYADKPYESTTKYSGDKFDHQDFWDFARTLHRRGHKVFVSEYKAPSDFTCVWSKVVNNTLVKDTGSKQGIEKLFTII